jgi:hypothetical protein
MTYFHDTRILNTILGFIAEISWGLLETKIIDERKICLNSIGSSMILFFGIRCIQFTFSKGARKAWENKYGNVIDFFDWLILNISLAF